MTETLPIITEEIYIASDLDTVRQWHEGLDARYIEIPRPGERRMRAMLAKGNLYVDQVLRLAGVTPPIVDDEPSPEEIFRDLDATDPPLRAIPAGIDVLLSARLDQSAISANTQLAAITYLYKAELIRRLYQIPVDSGDQLDSIAFLKLQFEPTYPLLFSVASTREERDRTMELLGFGACRVLKFATDRGWPA